MRSTNRIALLCSMALLLVAAPALAFERIDGEVGAVWWSSDLDSDGQGMTSSTDSGAPGIRAELWLLDKYGMRASQFGSDPEDLDTDGADYTSFDVMWRAFAPTENNFLAVGMGWQRMDFDGVGVDGGTSGVRLSVEGRVGFVKDIYGYGQGAYLPSLEDVRSTNKYYRDVSGYEYELGVAWNVMPYMNLRAGYRTNSVDFTASETVTSGGGVFPSKDTIGGNSGIGLSSDPDPGQGGQMVTTLGDGSTESTGFFIGLGFRF